MCRESFLQPAGYLACLGNIPDDALAVAIQLVKIDKPAHLVVIRLGVRIYHLLRSLTRTHVIAEIIENHIAIKYLALGFQSIRRETIVIVPGFHVTDNRLNITIRANGSLFLIIGKHLPNILRRKAQHLVELRLRRNMPADIETTRHIIQGHRTYSRDENPVEIALELLEDVTIETFGMGDCPIHILTLFVKHGVGEVVVFVDNQVKRISFGFRLVQDNSQFARRSFRFLHLFNRILAIIFLIIPDKSVQFHAQIKVEVLFKLFCAASNLRKVEMKNLEFTLQGSRMLAYPQITKPRIKPISGSYVVISMEHADEYALAKTARANKKEIVCLVFQKRQIHGLIHVILISLHNFHEIRNSVWYSFHILHNPTF